jgi:hypothetical protein
MRETVPTVISDILGGSGDVLAQLVEGLGMEFGCSDIAALADRISKAKGRTFRWQARVRERHLGTISVDGTRGSAWLAAAVARSICCGFAVSVVTRRLPKLLHRRALVIGFFGLGAARPASLRAPHAALLSLEINGAALTHRLA